MAGQRVAIGRYKSKVDASGKVRVEKAGQRLDVSARIRQTKSNKVRVARKGQT